MSTLTSASTDAEVAAAYDDNASYAEDGSAAKARAFVTACRILLRRRPATFSSNGRGHSFESVAAEMAKAQEWVEARSGEDADAGPRVTRVDFRNFR